MVLLCMTIYSPLFVWGEDSFQIVLRGARGLSHEILAKGAVQLEVKILLDSAVLGITWFNPQVLYGALVLRIEQEQMHAGHRT